ncbi:putative ribosomal protein S11, mitochondrial [Sesamum angolense]|uniref:Ribosomal protein S11, mitochondrial n=1 Tax=Sesamum angolense TaxID=2727404 RepID=A0AAE2BKV6_9LAMI|nr:putative ribosomal protein S11, mitochondrial [Sesamum angolense]
MIIISVAVHGILSVIAVICRLFHAMIDLYSSIMVPDFVWKGLTKNSKLEAHLESSILGNLGMKLGLVRGVENVSLPSALSLRSFIHSGKQAEVEAGGASRSVDYVQGILQERGPGLNGRTPLYQTQVESNADIVHIKLMRNNAFVTLTDSKGNKKIGVSAGKLAGKAGKLTRYSGEAAAEDIGRRVRQMKTRSVVVKVNGFTFFRRKKEAILSFKDGYSNMRGDTNPVVYIEDTTRKPHNGCRLPKKRRI